jgi:transcriptional regulator with XRE-family HTH domain
MRAVKVAGTVRNDSGIDYHSLPRVQYSGLDGETICTASPGVNTRTLAESSWHWMDMTREVSGMPDVGDAGAGDTFAVQLRRLFDSVRTEEGNKYTPREVAEELTRRGHKLSKSHVYALINGESDPSHAVVNALAGFFGVPLDYFADSERGRELNRQYEVLAALGEKNVQQIAYRASGLPPEKLRSILDYIDYLDSEASRERQRDD